MVADVVLFIDFFVNLSSEPWKDHLLPDGAVEEPNDDEVLNYGPRKLGDDVSGIGED